MLYYFAAMGTEDNPLYELEFGTFRLGGDGVLRFTQEMKELNPFVVHAALDVVEDVQWETNTLYLKAIDTFYGYLVSAYVTPGNVKMMLVHEGKNEEAIRHFFTDVNDLYVKTMLSPFYRLNDPIRSSVFDARVKALAKKYL